MSSFAPSQIAVCNRALQKLGAGTIASLDDGTEQARALSRAWDFVFAAELRAHPWQFAIRRAVLAAEVATPAFDWGYQYPLPADFLRFLPSHHPRAPWVVEGGKILSDDSGPLNVRYISLPDTFAHLDATFAEALACRLAAEICEALTQSSRKKDTAWAEYNRAVQEAKRAGAFEQPPGQPHQASTWADRF